MLRFASRFAFATTVALTLLACTQNTDASTDAACDRWKVAAKAYAACDPLYYPPVADDVDVTCRSAAAFARATKSAPATWNVADLATLDACTKWLGDVPTTCTRTLPRTSDDQSRLQHCTFEVVESWTPVSTGSACERWKALSAYLRSCDPAIFAEPGKDAKCVSDSQVSLFTGGRYNSVAECVDFLNARAFPCMVPLADRELCSNLLVP